MQEKPSSNELQQLDITRLIADCTRQTRAFFQQIDFEPGVCYELFRRALVEQAQAAWEAVYAEYTPLVTKWVREHPGFAGTDEDVAIFINCAFTGVWRNLSPAGRLERFPTLDSILAYLKACARSCVRDEYRKRCHRDNYGTPQEIWTSSVDQDVNQEVTYGGAATAPGPLQQVMQNDWREQLQALLEKHLRGEKERLIYLGSFEWDLKPREICELYPQMFEDVQEVYRLKRNLLERLSRDPMLEELARIR